MSSRERVIRALRFEYPDRAPRDLWALPGIPMFRQDELDAMLEKYPVDFAFPDFQYGPALERVVFLLKLVAILMNGEAFGRLGSLELWEK